MHLHFNNRIAKCQKSVDFGSHGEYYWTLQMFMDDEEQSFLYQGFSTGPEIDSGYSLKPNEEREVNDPKFTVNLPELRDGEERRVVTDFFCWESDRSSENVKKTFTNQAAECLWKIYEKNKREKKESLKEFEKWVSSRDDNTIASFIEDVTSLTNVMPYVALAKGAVPLVRSGIEVAKNTSDDFIGSNRVELFYKRVGDSYRFRWLANQGIEEYKGGFPVTFQQIFTFESGDRDEKIVTKSFFQIILD